MSYDANNIFAKILRGDIPCAKVYEDAHTLAFKDINPQCPVHVLVLPKGPYAAMDDFSEKASDAEVAALHRAIAKVAELTGVKDSGYRVIANCGSNGGQEVPHLHFHVLGGGPVGPMVSRRP